MRQAQAGQRSFCGGKRTASARPVGSLLSSMIRCAHCGHTFYGVRRRSSERGKPVERVFYTCHGYINKGKTVCKPLHIRREWIEGLVLDALRDHICTEAARAELRARITGFLQERRRAFAKGRAAISSKHTLALVNLGGATASEILALAEEIRERVEEVFGIGLKYEPVIWHGVPHSCG